MSARHSVARLIDASTIVTIAMTALGTSQAQAATREPQAQVRAEQGPDQKEARSAPVHGSQQTPAVQLWLDQKPATPFDGLFSEVKVTCTSCAVEGRLVSPNDAAGAATPWLFHGVVRHQTRLGLVSAGILGLRDQEAPLHGAGPLGGDGGSVGRSVSRLSAVTRPQWYFTASIEKTVATTSRGSTLGVIGDVIVPISPEPTAIGITPFDISSSAAGRVGAILRWK